MVIKKLVLTGGPCAGKTTGINLIKEEYSKIGWNVLVISEVATDLINGGIAPWTCGSNREFQKTIFVLQAAKEDAFAYAASTMKSEKVLILCDRGILDNKAYMNEDEYEEVLSFSKMTEEEVIGRYDGVIHLETAAKGKADQYTTANNTARYEDVAGAIKVDDRLLAAWENHPCRYVIPPYDNFDEKCAKLLDCAEKIVG